MWHYRNEEGEFIFNYFKKNSKFKPKRKNAATEIFLSWLEQEIFPLYRKVSF